MINIKTSIVNELHMRYSNTFECMPQDFNKFPIVAYSEEENTPHEYVSNGGEIVEESARITYKVDIYDLDSTTQIACDIDKIFLGYGFARKDCRDVPHKDYKHKTMRFSAIIDRNLNAIYFE